MQAVHLTFKYFQRVDKNKLQLQGSFTQIFNLSASAWRWPAPASALIADAEQPWCINEPFVAQHVSYQEFPPRIDQIFPTETSKWYSKG